MTVFPTKSLKGQPSIWGTEQGNRGHASAFQTHGFHPVQMPKLRMGLPVSTVQPDPPLPDLCKGLGRAGWTIPGGGFHGHDGKRGGETVRPYLPFWKLNLVIEAKERTYGDLKAFCELLPQTRVSAPGNPGEPTYPVLCPCLQDSEPGGRGTICRPFDARPSQTSPNPFPPLISSPSKQRTFGFLPGRRWRWRR